MVAKDGEIIASAVGADCIAFSCTDIVEHAETGVPVATRLEYRFCTGDDEFQVTFERRRDVFTLDFGSAGAYLRFQGDVSIVHTRDGQLSRGSGQTLWELLYFGERAGVPAAQGDVVIGHQA
jgi:hypothetical protein